MNMLKLIRISQISKSLHVLKSAKITSRTFLSSAYPCNEIWENRLNQPLFDKINLDELYHDLDLNFQKTKCMSAIDVDIFVNGLKDDIFDDEMLDLVHKLRLTEETSNSLPSLSYAVVKTLLENKKIEDLHTVLDDRLNYGIFLDTHMTNILLDHFWLKKDFVSGARIASQLMLQEDPEHPISHNLSLLHCYNCLLNKGEWSFPPPPEEPEEEVKVRVKYIRNEYDDQHFDLRDCKKILGKTLMYLTKTKKDSLNISFHILGAALFGRNDIAENKLEEALKNNSSLIKEVFDLLPEDSELRNKIENIKLSSCEINSILEKNVEEAIKIASETDIATQCKLFSEWNQKRIDLLREKEEAFKKMERLKKVESLKEELKTKETKLWFFENEEKMELEIEDIEEKKANESKNPSYFKEKKLDKATEEYIPPQVRK